MVVSALKTAIGKKIVAYLIAKAVKAEAVRQESFQTHQPAAVPPPETAPPTGGPHEAPDVVIKAEGGTVTRNEGGEFHWHNNQTVADVALEELREGRGSNGTSYSRSEE